MLIQARQAGFRLWALISNIGITATQADNIRKKVILTNQLCFLMVIGVSISTLVFASSNGHSEMAALIASLNLVPLITLLLNRYSHTDLSRLFFGITTPLLVLYIIVMLKVFGAYYGYSFHVREYHFYTPRYYLVALSLLPLLLIDLREKKIFAVSLVINVTCLALFDLAHDMFGVGYEHFGFQFHDYYQASVMPVVLLLFMYGSIIFYQFESKKYEDKILALMRQLKLHNDQVAVEINLAKQVVEGLLPKRMPSVDGLKLSAYLQWSSEVGGDYYNVEKIDENRTLFVVADVAGKGLAASLIVSTLHSYIETELNRTAFDLVNFISRMNQVMCKITDESKYVTCWIGVYNYVTCELESVNAGHPVPIVYNGNTGAMYELSVGSTILGFFEHEYVFKTETRALQKGDVLLVYTDGISEAENAEGRHYEDNDRLHVFLKKHAHGEPEYVVKALKRDVVEYTGTDLIDDDQTYMVIKKV